MASLMESYAQGAEAVQRADVASLQMLYNAGDVKASSDLLRSKAEESKVQTQKNQLEVQKMAKNMAEDTFIGEQTKSYLADPTNQQKSPEEMQADLFKIVAKTGDVDKMQNFAEKSAKTLQSLAIAKMDQGKVSENIAKNSRRAIDMIDSTGSNWDNVELYAQAAGLDPKGIAGVKQAIQAANGDPVKIKAIKDKFHEIFTTEDQRKDENTKAHNEAMEKALRDHQTHMELLRITANDKLIKAEQRKDDKATERLALQQNAQLVNENKQIASVIKNLKEDMTKLGSRPRVFGTDDYDAKKSAIQTKIDGYEDDLKTNNDDIKKWNSYVTDKIGRSKTTDLKDIKPDSDRTSSGKIGDESKLKSAVESAGQTYEPDKYEYKIVGDEVKRRPKGAK